jgi:hypothetical protein
MVTRKPMANLVTTVRHVIMASVRTLVNLVRKVTLGENITVGTQVRLVILVTMVITDTKITITSIAMFVTLVSKITLGENATVETIGMLVILVTDSNKGSRTHRMDIGNLGKECKLANQ